MQVSKENLAFFQALASETRLEMIQLLRENSLNVKELAAALGLSSTIIAKHVNQLEKVGIVRCENKPGARGLQKLCSLSMFGLVLSMKPEQPVGEDNIIQIPVGQFSKWDIQPTCGFSTEKHIIGEFDDPRFFADPRRIYAGIIWWGRGYVTYEIPNYMTSRQRMSQLSIQLEICSEAPGYNETWPSDIYFSINGVELGYWTCPGDFGAQKGVLTPDWWRSYGTQYGMLKTLTVNKSGSFVDGSRISGTTIDACGIQYGKPVEFCLNSPAHARNPGGIVLFGKTFGNYEQDIVVKMQYEERAQG